MFAVNGILFKHESGLRPERFVTQNLVRAAYRISQGSAEILNLGDLSISRDWGWAPEYVKAMWLMFQVEQADDFVIAKGQSHSLIDLVAQAFACYGRRKLYHLTLLKGVAVFV